MRVTAERYEVESPDQIMVYGTDDRGDKVCFRVRGPEVENMRETIDSGVVEFDLPDREPERRLS